MVNDLEKWGQIHGGNQTWLKLAGCSSQLSLSLWGSNVGLIKEVRDHLPHHLSGKLEGLLLSGNICHFLQFSHWTQLSHEVEHHSNFVSAPEAPSWHKLLIWSSRQLLTWSPSSFWVTPFVIIFTSSSAEVLAFSVIPGAVVSDLTFVWWP